VQFVMFVDAVRSGRDLWMEYVMTNFDSCGRRLWFVVMLAISMLALSSVAEAGRRKRCSTCAPRSCMTSAVCKSASVTRVESQSTVIEPQVVYSQAMPATSTVIHEKTKAASRIHCANGQCRFVSSAAVKTKSVTEISSGSGWQAEAQRQANLMAQRNTHGHVATAQETAQNAGASSASVFVGVGMDGKTCQGSGRLVADAVATANGHSYHCRIWLR